jgi:hypothetical protein
LFNLSLHQLASGDISKRAYHRLGSLFGTIPMGLNGSKNIIQILRPDTGFGALSCGDVDFNDIGIFIVMMAHERMGRLMKAMAPSATDSDSLGGLVVLSRLNAMH